MPGKVTMSALAVAMSLFPASAHAETASPFTGETSFGDSLSDAGNFAILVGLPAPFRFTTNPGLTAVENVAAHYDLPLSASSLGGSDYAYGSAGVVTNAPSTPAGVPTVTQQVGTYLAAHPKLSPTELYSVFGGANDIFYHATSVAAAQAASQFAAAATIGPTPAQAAMTTAAINAQVEQSQGITTLETPFQAALAIGDAATQEIMLIGNLQQAGARYIVVFNLPDIGKTPSGAAQDLASPGSAASLTALSAGFNNVLSLGLASLEVGIIPVNTFALLNEVIAHPAIFGFVNIMTPACATQSSLTCTPATLVNATAATNFLFADDVHPTTAGHAAIAQVVESEILGAQQISILTEQPLAMLATERNTIDQQLLASQFQKEAGPHLFVAGSLVRERFSDQFVPQANHSDALATIGLTDQVNPSLIVGGAFTFGTSHQAPGGQLRHVRTKAAMGSLFGQYTQGPIYLGGSLGYGRLRLSDIERAFALGASTRVEQGSTDGDTVSVYAGGGYWLGNGSFRAGPFVSAIYERVHIGGYGEKSGDSTAMLFAGQTRVSAIGEAGARIQGSLPSGNMIFHPFGEVAYAHDWDAHGRSVTAGLTTMSGTFAIPGYVPDRAWGAAQMGVGASIGQRVTATIAYQGRFAGRSGAYNGVTAAVSYAL